MSAAEVSKPSYSPGLEGVVAGESAICTLDPAEGLLYRGYNIDELATRLGFEDIVYLLLRGELPDAGQLEATRRELAAEQGLPPAVVAALRLMPKGAAPIDVL